MKLSLLLLLAVTASAGCNSPEPPKQVKTVAPVPPPSFFMSAPVSSGYINFHLTLTRPLRGSRTLIIISESSPWLEDDLEGDSDLTFTDELQQPNGAQVIFDCGHIADKIIDRSLVAEITPLCVQGHKLATDYWTQHHGIPDEFTDSTRTRWKKE